jgi:outer membrane protein assembly factor BamB
LFVGSCAGLFFAFNKNTGAIQWTFDARPDQNSSFHGDPIVTDDLVIFDADLPKGHAYAVERKTGALRWKFRADEGVPTDLVRHDDAVFAATSNDRLVALDLRTGRLRWDRSSGADREGLKGAVAPRVVGNVVLFAAQTGVVYALDANTGEIRWSRQLEGRLNTPPVPIDGHVFVGSNRNVMYRLDLASGAIERKLELPGIAYGNPTPIHDGIIVPVYQNTLVCLDRDLTRIIWQQSGRSWALRPLIWQGLIVIGNAAGDLFAFNPNDGAPAWSHHFKGIITSTGSSGDVLYVGTQEGTVFAVRRVK